MRSETISAKPNDARPGLADRVPFLLEAARGKSVLHLGCTNHPYTDLSIAEGTLLHAKLSACAARLTGIDSDLEGIAELEKYNFGPILHGDLEVLSEVPLREEFEVVIAGEVIEHLSNPGAFLRGVKRFVGDNGRLIITTVNAYCGMRFAQYALRGRGGRVEPVHPDHVAYYSLKTLNLILERHGFLVEDLHFYDLGSEHRVHNRMALNLINDLCVKASPQLADGIIAVCRNAE